MRAIDGAQGVAGAYALDSAGYETLLAIAQRGHLTGRGIVPALSDCADDSGIPGVLAMLARAMSLKLRCFEGGAAMPSEPRCVLLEPSDSRYPAMLLDLPGEPPRLFVRGVVPSFGVRTCRGRMCRATPYGLAVAELAAKIAVESGIAVVSGGAVGCDQAAGRCAVQRGGRNAIVLGCGADVVYPKSSASLINRTIEGGGAVISLEPWGTPPRRYAFPKRIFRSLPRCRGRRLCARRVCRQGRSLWLKRPPLGREVLAVPGLYICTGVSWYQLLITVGATCIVDEESLESQFRLYGTMRYCHDAPADDRGRERSIA